MRKSYRVLIRTVLTMSVIFVVASSASAYSVLTHQAIIDSNWDQSIKPLLLRRFPSASEEQLRVARAHAYGGAIIQDMGYYPFGNKFFSDLVHYVRSGDFIEALISESQDLNEYAFSLGALAHYAADSKGHELGTNRAVPVIYPKLRARYGDTVTYADDKTSHLKVEFGFDVVQVARGRYAPDAYHDFIGFKVSRPVLERAFQETYGLELDQVLPNVDLAIGTFRRTVSGLIPEMTKVAWELKKDELEKSSPGITREKFVYNLSRAGYEREWGREYEKPGMMARVIAFTVRIVPKVGPFRILAFKPPTPETEQMFMNSFNATVEEYRASLAHVGAGQLALENRDFDTGRRTVAGEYRLADEAYSRLLRRLAEKDFEKLTPALREDILAFFNSSNAVALRVKDKSDLRDTKRALERLKSEAAVRSSQGADQQPVRPAPFSPRPR